MLDSRPHKTDSQAHAERRRAVRICCTGWAEGLSIDPSQLFRGEIRNVSETGCFITLRVPVNLPRGTPVQLRFKMGRAEYCARARVVEALPCTGIRMQFISTDPAFTERMRQIVSTNSNTQG